MLEEITNLIKEIETYCQQAEMSESTFGRQVVNDGKFVSRLRNGKGVTLKTLLKTRNYIKANTPTKFVRCLSDAEGIESPVPATAVTAIENQQSDGYTPFRFYDNRQKYLAFVNTCNEKWAIAQRAGKEMQHIRPVPPALRIFDAGMGDGTVLTYLMRNLHRKFPTVPLFINTKEISLEDIRLGLSKLPDRFCEHPATVFVISNLHYSEAPWLMPGNVNLAAALNWHEVRLEGASAHEYGEQIESLRALLADGWKTQSSPATGNPLYVRPSVLVIYREDHRFLLENVIPHPGQNTGNYDLILASQPWRARISAEFKVGKILMPLTRGLAPGGRLLAIQSYGNDPGLDIVRKIWPDENPFTVNRHQLIKGLKDGLGREAKDFNFNAFSDAKSIFRYDMHTLPSEIDDRIGTSTLFAAWNAVIYVNQIEDERLQDAILTGEYLQATSEGLKKNNGLWFNDETFVVSRRQD
ncbi:MAG: hypothetical protein O6928_06265 [Gammaproteobacteria bacterium]|nr:hypothetical protein [Gammaproteobacteria bacterium]